MAVWGVGSRSEKRSLQQSSNVAEVSNYRRSTQTFIEQQPALSQMCERMMSCRAQPDLYCIHPLDCLGRKIKTLFSDINDGGNGTLLTVSHTQLWITRGCNVICGCNLMTDRGSV